MLSSAQRLEKQKEHNKKVEELKSKIEKIKSSDCEFAGGKEKIRNDDKERWKK